MRFLDDLKKLTKPYDDDDLFDDEEDEEFENELDEYFDDAE